MRKLLEKYQEHGSFIFYCHENLKFVCTAPTTKSGIYLFYGIGEEKKTLVYVGCSGHIKNDGSVSVRKTGLGGIRGRIVNGQQFGKVKRYVSLPLKMKMDGFVALEVHWYVTCTAEYKDSPCFVEACLLQNHLDEHHHLPLWNRKF